MSWKLAVSMARSLMQATKNRSLLCTQLLATPPPSTGPSPEPAAQGVVLLREPAAGGALRPYLLLCPRGAGALHFQSAPCRAAHAPGCEFRWLCRRGQAAAHRLTRWGVLKWQLCCTSHIASRRKFDMALLMRPLLHAHPPALLPSAGAAPLPVGAGLL